MVLQRTQTREGMAMVGFRCMSPNPARLAPSSPAPIRSNYIILQHYYYYFFIQNNNFIIQLFLYNITLLAIQIINQRPPQ